MIPVAEILVFCLYVLLIQEIIEIFVFGKRTNDNSNALQLKKTGGGSTNYQRRCETSAAFRIHHGTTLIKIRSPNIPKTRPKNTRVKVQPVEKPKSINSLDGLWRRMRQATENYRLFHKKDAMITDVMSVARAEAYDAMVKKNSQEKQKLLKTNRNAENDKN